MAIFTMRWRGAAASQVGTRIDGFGQHHAIPSRTAISGMIGAAMGYRVGDKRLEELQENITYAVVVHDPGTTYIDYQTADLGRMPRRRWWNDGSQVGIIEREGSAVTGTRIQNRPLAADVNMTIFVETDYLPADEILAALDEPVFPLYLGRENCPPSGRVAGTVSQSDSLQAAVADMEGVIYLPVEHMDWGDTVISIPARGRSADRFIVSVA